MNESATLVSSWLGSVAPHGTAVAAGAIGPAVAFDDSEHAAVAHAIGKRRDEFLTGRSLARRALDELGCPAVAIPVGDRRMPVWPRGYVGSISHSGGLCVAHVGRSGNLASIGIDIELVGALEPDLVRHVCSPEEWAALERNRISDIDPGTLYFSGKEAVYKAYFPVTRAFLDYTDVWLQIDWAQGCFEAQINFGKPSISDGWKVAGRFSRIGDHIVTAVWIERRLT
ncbi:4'-phosphopantetheinyl transferase [Bradyrhizobium sp. CB1015]|uniref:4'-phosphopantetheinyl transferase family protein n=1 Tax=Bradyrhizobium sp. CB1015 TaxID=2976822 RepID=UPI003905AB87